MTALAMSAEPSEGALAPLPRLEIDAPAPVPAAIPEFAWIPLDSLRVSPSYQRAVSARSRGVVARGARSFSWSRVKALNVVARPGGLYEVVDGQHTAMILAAIGAAAAPCLVARAAARPAADFVSLNANRTILSPLQRFRAELAAGDAEAAALSAAAEASGATILVAPPARGDYPAGSTVAIPSLKAVRARQGDAGLRRLLGVAVAAGLAPIDKLMVEALEILMFAPEFGSVPDAALAEVVAAKGFSARDAAKTAKAAHGIPLKRGLAVALNIRAQQMLGAKPRAAHG